MNFNQTYCHVLFSSTQCMANTCSCFKRSRSTLICRDANRVTVKSCILLSPSISVSFDIGILPRLCILNNYFSPAAAYCDGHLLVYSETHLDIFNTQTAEWVQSIGLKRSRPLMNNGSLTLTYINDGVNVVYLANMHTSMFCLHRLEYLNNVNFNAHFF